MSHIRLDSEGPVGILTIDRRERFNSLDVETARDLRRAGIQLARDEAIRSVILRGEGRVFCSGADLKYIRAGGEKEDLDYLVPSTGDDAATEGAPKGYGHIFKEILEYIHSTISEIRRSPKPWIAAVDGIAAAGGFGLAMSCDLVYASQSAIFEWAYGKTGLTGAESSTFFLPRLLGFRRAMEILFLNPRLDASRAKEIGLVTEVFDDDLFDGSVMDVAKRLAAGPTEAWGIAKNLINQAAGVDRLDHHLERELDNLARIADGRNFAEGIDAFLGKRSPDFAAK